MVFALGVALAVFGLRPARLAGLLMIVAAAAQFLASVLMTGGGPGPRFGGSSGVVVLPLLLAGVLFMLAGERAGDRLRIRE